MWRMPRNANNNANRYSNYAIQCANSEGIECASMSAFLPNTAGIANTDITFNIWIKPEFEYDTSNYQTVYGNANANQGILLYYWHDANCWRGLVGTGVGLDWIQGPTYNSNEELGKGEWQMHTFIIKVDTLELEYYINGVSITPAVSLAGAPSVLRTMQIGKRWDLSTGEYIGEFTEASVFDYALSTSGVNSELSLLYNEGAPINPFAILAKEPVAYWRTGDNTKLSNSSLYVPNLSAGGQNVFDFAKANNGVIKLSTDDWINENLPASHITVSAWVNPVSWTDTSFRTIVGKFGAGASTQQWRIVAIGSNTIRFNIYGKSPFGATYTLETDDVVVPADKREGWLNIIWRHAPGIGSNVKFNNENETSLPNLFAKPMIKPLVGSTPNSIGGVIASGSPAFPWDGELANIEFFETYLSDEEATEIYNGGRPLMTKPQPQEDNLAGWWKLDAPSSAFNPGISGVAFVANQIGTPDVSGGGDHAYVNPSLSPLVFDCQDLNSANAGGPTYDINIPIADGIAWESLLIKGAYSDLVIETDIDLQRGGAFGGAKAQLFYSIDGGAWTSFGIINVGVSDPLGLTKFLTNSPTLSCLDSIQFKAEIGTRTYSADRCRINSIKIANAGEYLYNEDFSSQSGVGWNNNVYVPANNEIYVEDAWKINDSRSYYPQSFNFDFNTVTPQYVNVQNPADLQFASSFTISGWMYPSGTGNYPLIDKCISAASGNGYHIDYRNNGEIHAWAYWAADKIVVTGYNDNQWYHVALVFDHTGGSNGTQYLYVNGVLAGSQATTNFAASTAADLYIGGASVLGPSANYWFNGGLSNVQMWDAVIPATGGDSIETLYNKGVPTTTPIASANLSGWWKLDSSDSFDVLTGEWTVADNSANSNPGTSSGMGLSALANNNVSTNNGLSENVPQSALQKSNIANTQSYSNYSFNFDAASSDGFKIDYISGGPIQPSNTVLEDVGFSVSAWISVDTSLAAGNGIWQNDGYSGTAPINYGGLLLQINQTGIVNVGYATGGGTGTAFRKNYLSTAVLSTNTWHHVIVVYRGIDNNPLLYVDGVEYTSGWSSTGSAAVLGYTPLGFGTIGIVRDGVSGTNGLISNLALFNTTLSAQDAQTIYNNGITQNLLESAIPPPTCWYPLDESSSYYSGSEWTIRDIVPLRTIDGTGLNTGNVDDMVGKAPGSYSNGTGVNLIIDDLMGQSSESIKNSYSINMADYGSPNDTFPLTPAPSGRTTFTPGP